MRSSGLPRSSVLNRSGTGTCGTFAADAASLAPWLEGAARNTDRNLRLQYLAGDGLNVFAAGEIFDALAAREAPFPAALFTGTPAQLEELRQRLAARQGRY